MSYDPGCSPIMRKRHSFIVQETPLINQSPKKSNPKRKRVPKQKKILKKSPSRRSKMNKCHMLELQCKAGKEGHYYTRAIPFFCVTIWSGETESSESNSSDDADLSNLSMVSDGNHHSDGSFSAYRLGQSSQAEKHGFTVPLNQVRFGDRDNICDRILERRKMKKKALTLSFKLKTLSLETPKTNDIGLNPFCVETSNHESIAALTKSILPGSLISSIEDSVYPLIVPSIVGTLPMSLLPQVDPTANHFSIGVYPLFSSRIPGRLSLRGKIHEVKNLKLPVPFKSIWHTPAWHTTCS